MSDLHEYKDEFFEYIERGSISSAKRFAAYLVPLLHIDSLLDVGCGRGAWLREWHAAGVKDVHGVDGPYVNVNSLLVRQQDFTPTDLSRHFNLGRKFDLVTSLEVAEHLPPSSSGEFIDSLVNHSDLVLFSAATPGQGGENHINERPLTFWQGLFRERGYSAYDVVRPEFRSDNAVEPWYRFNSVLYAKDAASAGLPDAVKTTLVAPSQLREVGDANWVARKLALRMLPVSTVTALSRWNYRRLNRAHQRQMKNEAR